MKTVTRKLAKVKRITVDCVRNDPVDMRCGGPPVLGFDFLIDADEDAQEYVRHIKKKLKEFDVPLMSISVSRAKEEIPVRHVWTKNKISRCIKRDGPGMR